MKPLLRRLAIRGPKALTRWSTLRRLRLLYGREAFGDGCDIRRGAEVTVSPGSTLRVGENAILDRGITLEASGVLRVGDRVTFGHHCTVAARELVEIGADCLIAELVSIRDHDHESRDSTIPIRLQGARTAPVHIGRNVWLGSKVTVLKGVRIGDNAIIAAGAVVTKDVPADVIAAGVPARVLRARGAPESA